MTTVTIKYDDNEVDIIENVDDVKLFTNSRGEKRVQVRGKSDFMEVGKEVVKSVVINIEG